MRSVDYAKIVTTTTVREVVLTVLHKYRMLDKDPASPSSCCVYWAVRKARMEIMGERVGQREEGKDLEMKRNFLLEQFTFLHDSFFIDLVYFIFSDFFLGSFPLIF